MGKVPQVYKNIVDIGIDNFGTVSLKIAGNPTEEQSNTLSKLIAEAVMKSGVLTRYSGVFNRGVSIGGRRVKVDAGISTPDAADSTGDVFITDDLAEAKTTPPALNLNMANARIERNKIVGVERNGTRTYAVHENGLKVLVAWDVAAHDLEITSRNGVKRKVHRPAQRRYRQNGPYGDLIRFL